MAKPKKESEQKDQQEEQTDDQPEAQAEETEKHQDMAPPGRSLALDD